MHTRRVAILTTLFAGVSQVLAQTALSEAHIGYAYPAGGQTGEKIYVTVGGQFLRGASEAFITGEGVTAKVIGQYRPPRAAQPEERRALGDQLRDLIQERVREEFPALAEHMPKPKAKPAAKRVANKPEQRKGKRTQAKDKPAKAEAKDAEEVEPTQLACTYDLEHKSLRELLHVANYLESLRGAQRNDQIAETVLLEINIARGAQLGQRELRLMTRQGLTNPLAFQVSAMPEAQEYELGRRPIAQRLPEAPPLKPPVTINGQVMPGDIDRFRFSAKQGQQLVIECQARRLNPYLADAVPGWFQATLSLFDPNDQEVAFRDDYRFSPDPVICYEVPADGTYALEIHDSIYRGREDFVYRLSIAERPFIGSIFPLGCPAGGERRVYVDAWGSHVSRMKINPHSNTPGEIESNVIGRGERISNEVLYQVNDLPTAYEKEANDEPKQAQHIRLPRMIDGRIEKSGDLDLYRFSGKQGEEVVAEVIARRLNSPLDGLLRLIDEDGNVLAWNDDYEYKQGFLHTGMGVLTHHADPYLRTTLPRDGNYYVQVSDTQCHGGQEYTYRLRISPPQYDATVYVTPASVNVRGSLSAVLHVHALRQDGFSGPIKLALEDAPLGFELAGAVIPAGRDEVRITLSGPARRLKEPVELKLIGAATINGRTHTTRVTPAENQMQAFLYRHLTPAQTLLVATPGGRQFSKPIRLASRAPILIPAGGNAIARLEVPIHPLMEESDYVLNEPPDGITLSDISLESDTLVLEFSAARDQATVGMGDNLIVDVYHDFERHRQRGDGRVRQRVLLGCLPAIPIEVVHP